MPGRAYRGNDAETRAHSNSSWCREGPRVSLINGLSRTKESRAWPGTPDSHPSWRPPAMGVLSGFSPWPCFPTMAPATWANNVPLESAGDRCEPLDSDGMWTKRGPGVPRSWRLRRAEGWPRLCMSLGRGVLLMIWWLGLHPLEVKLLEPWAVVANGSNSTLSRRSLTRSGSASGRSYQLPPATRNWVPYSCPKGRPQQGQSGAASPDLAREVRRIHPLWRRSEAGRSLVELHPTER